MRTKIERTRIAGPQCADSLKETLIHAVTRYDEKQSARKGYNIYALPQYLAAVDRTVADYEAGATVPEAIRRQFIDRLRDHVLKACNLEI